MEKPEFPEGMTHYVYATSSYMLEEVLKTKDYSDCCFSRHWHTTLEDWTFVGFAKIEVQGISERNMRLKAAEALDELIEKTRVEAQIRINGFEKKKQQLLALEYTE